MGYLDENRRLNLFRVLEILAVVVPYAVIFYNLCAAAIAKFQEQPTPVALIIILIVLGAFSIQSIIFFLKVIVKMEKDLLQLLSSVLLVGAFFFLIYVSLHWWQSLLLIPAGTICISLKAWQLYLLSKEDEVVKTYFRRIVWSYLAVTFFTLIIGLLVEYRVGIFDIFPRDQIETEYGKINIESELSLLEADSLKPDLMSLKEGIGQLHSKWKVANNLGNIYLALAISAWLLLIFYFVYKSIIMREVSVNQVLKRLEDSFQQKNDGSKKSDSVNPSGQAGKTVLSLIFAVMAGVRFFISSVAGIIAASVYSSTSPLPSLTKVFLTFAVVTLTSGFGFILNDYIDTDKDRISHPHRVLPSGKLSRRQVILMIPILVGGSILFSLYLGKEALLIDVMTILLLSLYSFINNKYGIWANAITALTSSFTLIFGMIVGGFSLPIAITSVGTFFLIFGREIILDIRDLTGDTAWGKTSVPIRYGIKKAIDISGFLLLVSSLLFISAAAGLGTISFIFFVAILSNVLLWFGFLSYRSNLDSASMERFLVLTRLSFLCIVPGLLL